MPRMPIPDPIKHIVTDIEESVMETAVGFPSASVHMAKNMIIAELNSMGFKGAQIKVSSPINDGFICEAIIDTPRGKTTIEIPIEMRNNSPLIPSVFASGDYVADFNTQNLRNFVIGNPNSKIVSTQLTALGDMDLLQLKNFIVQSALGNDFESCDEAISVIGEKFDNETYKNTILDYNKMLLSFGSTKENIKSAYEDNDQFIMTPNSIYPIHKKFGRPINDLIKDENGVYHLKSTYAAKQISKDAGAFFSTGKILLGD